MAPITIAAARTDYATIKTAIHRKLIQKLNLEKLSEIKREDVGERSRKYWNRWLLVSPRQ